MKQTIPILIKFYCLYMASSLLYSDLYLIRNKCRNTVVEGINFSWAQMFKHVFVNENIHNLWKPATK